MAKIGSAEAVYSSAPSKKEIKRKEAEEVVYTPLSKEEIGNLIQQEAASKINHRFAPSWGQDNVPKIKADIARAKVSDEVASNITRQVAETVPIFQKENFTPSGLKSAVAKDIKDNQENRLKRTLIPSVNYDSDEAELEAIRQKRTNAFVQKEKAQKNWNDWKNSEGTALQKGLDYIGGTEVSNLRQDLSNKENEYNLLDEEYTLKKQQIAEKRIQQKYGVNGNEYIALLEQKRENAQSDSEKDYYEKEIKKTRNELYGKTNVFEHIGNIAKEGLLQYNKGVAATVDFLLGTPAKWLGFENNIFTQANKDSTRWLEEASMDTYKGAQALGDVNNLSGQFGTALIAAAPDLLLTILSGGTSKTKELGTAAIELANPTFWNTLKNEIIQTVKSPIFYTSFVRELGTNYEENLKGGANDAQATLAAFFASAVTAKMEIGGFQSLGDELAETKGAWRKLYKWALSSMEEGLEEPAQTSATNLINKIVYDHDKKIVSTTDEDSVFNLKRAAKEFAIGTFVGAALGGGQLTFSGIVNAKSDSQYKQIGKAAIENTNIQEIIDYAKSSPNDVVRSIARQVDAKTISDADAGRVYQYAVTSVNEQFDEVNTVDDLNKVISNYFMTSTTPQAVKDIASAKFAEKLVEMNIDPETYEGLTPETAEQSTPTTESEVESGLVPVEQSGEVSETPVESQQERETVFTEPTNQEIYRDPAVFADNGQNINAQSTLTSSPSNNNILQGDNVGNTNIPINSQNNFQNDTFASGEFSRPDGKIATFGGIDTDKGRHLDKAQQDEIKDIGEKLGREVEFEDFYLLDKFKGKKKIPDGYIDKDGTVHINYYAKRPVQFLLKHEITHYLKRSLQSYVDFMNLVFESEAFNDWLNKKGYTVDTLKTEIMETYSEVKDFNEERCYDEILADFVGEYLFGGEYAVSQNLINALEPKKKKTFGDVIRSIINYFKNKFSKNKTLKTEIEQIENEFIKVYKEAVEVKADEAVEESYSFTGYAEDGRGKYKSNFPKGTPKIAKADKILNYIQNVWSKKPIKLKIEENGNIKYIEAKFDPTYDASGNIPTDASKLMGGNRHGTSSEQRVTLDLADDYYQIASESQYNYSKDETGKDNPAHKDVTKWHYFINDIYFAEYDSNEYEPYRVSINVKEKADGEYVYSFSAEKQRESDTPRTLHAVVNERENPNANVELSNNKVTQNKPIVKNNISKDGDFYSIPNSTTDRKSILTDLANGTITVEQAEKLLSSNKTLNPIEIANLSQKDADTTASEHKRQQGENNGDGESKFYDSLMKSNIFDLRFKDEIKDDSFIEKYKTITNKETLKTAAKELGEGGADYVERWWAITPERASLVDTAVGFILMDRYQRIGNYEQAVAVAEKVREFGTAGGQQVQIFSIIGRFNPDMMVAYAQKELSQAYESMVEGKTKKWIDNNKDKFQLTEKDIEFIRRHTLQAAMFEDGTRPKAIALAEIQKLLQDKIPPELGDSIRAFQRNAMLLNVKTNVRNVTGNAGMVGVFIASDLFGSGIDKALAKKTGVRTTGNFDVKSVAGFKKGLYESYDDFKRGISTKQEELNRFDTNTRRGNKSFNESGEGVFGTKILKKQLNDVAKALNKIDNFTSFCLEAGDRPFFEMWYMNSLNTQLKLNNLEIPTPEMLEIAKEEALKRTWQDDNIYTRAISNLKRNLNIVRIPGTSYGLGDFIYKFVKTPTNLAKAIVEFSPLGFAGATNNAIKLKNAIETNQFNPQLQKEFVRSASNAITGTLVYALVAIGAALGIVKLSGDGDDDKDVSNYEKYVMGIPPYSIEFFGVNMTYDWMQPFGSVLATVADFMQTKKEEPELKTSAAIWEAIKAGGKTFTKQSFLQSMYEFFSQDDIVDGLSSLVLAEPSAFIPQAFSQLASYLDKYRRTTYDSTNAFQTSINKVIAKIPGLRTKLPKQVNVLGEDAKNTQYLNVWEAFASPWNTYPKSSKEVVNEIYELYKKTGENSVIPRTAPNNFTVKGDKVSLTPEQKADFQKSIGQNSAEMLGILFNEPQYKNLSDSEKVDVVGKIYGFAYAKAKSEIKYDYKTLSAMAGEYKNGKPVLSEESYKKLPEKAKQMIAQEYFLSKIEYRYIDNYKSLVQSYIQKVKE